ncbi:hypothetical protein SAY86_011934 [Trapa natans]|uniref:Uncharacterized protein n=1 Tax=Trapa natans TaxID=22666 RepID=A0AAN7RA70_TRANT|nr:hypothetical protein SAY86_011934 [Trapa natans]
MAGSDSSLLPPQPYNTVYGAVDYLGQPASRSSTGRWKSALFIIGVEVAERFAYYGIASNLITYLTGPLGQSTALAAENVNAWGGAASLLPLLGALVADSYLGRYRTIIVASLLYILGLGLLTLSAFLTSLSTTICESEVVLFFASLYLVAIAQGGHKPCVQAFGADQFDADDPIESKEKSSFFNWWYFGLCGGATVTMLIVVYIQDNLNWSLGFGIPCIAMVVALAVFLIGTRTYRFSARRAGRKSPFLRIGQVFISAIRNWRSTASSMAVQEEEEEEAHGLLLQPSYDQFKFLNKALLAPDDSKVNATACTVSEVEEAKSTLRLVPIWFTSLVFAIVAAQTSTFFTKQGATMDRKLFFGFKIPAASLQVFTGLAIVTIVPIYDQVFVPIVRLLTHKPSGITTLQRIGIGIFLSILCIITAALVEIKRLETARALGLVDLPDATIPMSIWWLVPQYLIFGIAQVFTMVGLQEFFYDQVPDELKSIGLALYLSVLGVGSLLSSILVSIIEKVTSCNGGAGWFSDNLNKAHLDYFYWLLGGLSTISLAAFSYFSRSYIYRRRTT